MARNPLYENPFRSPEDCGVLHVCRKVTLGDPKLAVGTFPIGAAEKNAIPIRAGVSITTVFNAATTNVLTLGTTADDDGFVTSANAAAGTLGVKEGSGALMGIPLAADTVFYAKFTQTGTAATTGEGYMWVEFLVPRSRNPNTLAGS